MTVLLLNATYTPLRIITLKRAVVLVLQQKAEIVEEEPDRLVRAARISLPAPKVIRLTRFVKVPYRGRIPLTGRAVLVRDKHVCAYCGRRANTIDHVVPKSRDGKHSWENVVAACTACNAKKSNRLLSELGWNLSFKPFAPKGNFWLVFGITEPDPVWDQYLAVA
jgi:5-methylcytosine-specific restriction endonuclease McrA